MREHEEKLEFDKPRGYRFDNFRTTFYKTSKRPGLIILRLLLSCKIIIYGGHNEHVNLNTAILHAGEHAHRGVEVLLSLPQMVSQNRVRIF